MGSSAAPDAPASTTRSDIASLLEGQTPVKLGRTALLDITNDVIALGLSTGNSKKAAGVELSKEVQGSGNHLLDLKSVAIYSVDVPDRSSVEGAVPVTALHADNEKTTKGSLLPTVGHFEEYCSSSWSTSSSEERGEEDDDYYYDAEDDTFFDGLCEDLMHMKVEEKRELPKFTGKHTRFIYSSDGEEIEGAEETVEAQLSPNVLLLKGLPMPEGKHLRFQEDDDAED